MRRKVIAASAGIVLVWVLWYLFRAPVVLEQLGVEPPETLITTISLAGAGLTQSIDTIRCPPGPNVLCAPTDVRGVTVLMNYPFQLSVAKSGVLEARVQYWDTLTKLPRSLEKDSVGVRLIGVEGAIAVQPTEIRYSKVQLGNMGPWEWTLAPQRPGSYELLFELSRLPSELRKLLEPTDPTENALAERTSIAFGPILSDRNRIRIHVATATGLSAETEAWGRIIAWTLSFLIAAVPVSEWIKRQLRPDTEARRRTSRSR